ncbi:MAG: Hsp20/alpha crystallin family protein [Gemmatales bacterium]|nr:Hsp20/alpha crystallin family protein [Gemmatales bacterium]MCS7159414.1 Hsp20/alpha crystallin family protein [Gemmatales bacterium]MDW8174613.1 Hsp20/alpha crystallin family protein [Gemmatales bacterium]MDW8222748.1 Hsp20/alpha crystallin family protein [Gemmatales bacterium]
MLIWPLRNSWEVFDELQREMERLFNLTLIGNRFFWEASRQYPPVNVYETDKEYLLLAPVPGLKPQDLEVTAIGDRLSIRGERRRQQISADETFRREERWMGSWFRTFSLPDRADSERISATLDNGLLMVRIAKLPESPVRQVHIRTA